MGRTALATVTEPEAEASQPGADLSGRLVGAALLSAAVLVPLFRQRGTPSWKTVWAEDGGIYTQQTVLRGTARTLFEGYNGYLQLPPCLLVIPTPFFPLRFLAIYCVLAGTITAAMLAWFIYHSTQEWITSKVLRVAVASLVVVAPTMGIDSTANVTNTIWLFLAALPWALISLQETRRDTVLRAIVAFLAATSSALSLIFVPLALGWWFYRRTRSAMTVGVAFLAGVMIQIVVSVSIKAPSAQPNKLATAIPQLLRDICVRVFGVFLFGTRWQADLWHASWLGLVIICPIIVVALLGLLMPGASRRAQVMSASFLVMAILVFSVSVWGRGLVGFLLTNGGVDELGFVRFSTPAIMLVAGAFAILISRLDRRVSLVFAVQIAILAIVCFSVTNVRGKDSSWISRVDQAQAADCPGRLVTIPNTIYASNYFRFSNGFFPVTVHCSNL